MTDKASWPKVTKEHPCLICGHTSGCRNAPDGTAAVCWHAGNAGNVIQCGAGSNNFHASKKNINGTDSYSGTARKSTKTTKKTFVTADEALKDAAWNIKDGVRTAVWTYPHSTFKIARFDTPDSKKHIRPVHLGDSGWMVGDPPGELPLYGSDEIPADAKFVFVTEGEKCRDIAKMIGLSAVTSSHGAGAADRSDWTTIANLQAVIVFLPDNDEPGDKYVADAARIIFKINRKVRIKIVKLPDLPPAGDIEQYVDARDSMDTEAIAGSIIALVNNSPFMADPDPELSATSSTVLLRDFPELRKPLIEGVMRMTETCNVIAAAKGGKTHLALDLGLSVVTGRAWLKQYPVRNPGPVLYVDAELHPNTMARRIAAICTARGIFSSEIDGKLDVLSLRGRLKDVFQLAPWLAKNASGKYSLIVFDALYRLIPQGIDENSNSDMTRVFNAVDQIADATGAAVVIVHHASKGVQGGKSVVDVGSGASAMARATDTHLIFRQHEEDGCMVLDMAARSWPPMMPVGLRFNYPTWDIDSTLDTEALRVDGRRKRKDEAPESTPEQQIKWTPEMFVETFLTEQPKTESMILTTANAGELSERAAKRLLSAAIDTGIAHRWTYSDRKKSHRFSTIEQPLHETGNGVTE